MSERCSCSQVKNPGPECDLANIKPFVPRQERQKKLLKRFAERVYESCAAYNLRYCSLGRVPSRSAARDSARDLLLLLCFFVANAVVLLAIVLRAACDVSAAARALASGIRRKVSSKKHDDAQLLQDSSPRENSSMADDR